MRSATPDHALAAPLILPVPTAEETGVGRIGELVARHGRVGLGLAIGLLIAGAVGCLLVYPLNASPIGYDTAGSVLYFQRITHGQLLEQPFGATPKPLMTLVEGGLYALGGWRAVSIAAVAVCAIVVTFGAELVRRAAGRTPAVFAFVALLGSQPLVLDEVRAYAVGWLCLWLLIAAFALGARRPRFALAGLALCAAVLTRVEAVVVVAGAMGCLAAWIWLVPPVEGRWPGRLGLGAAPRRAWLVALGLLAFPVMLVHDWLLTRDPLYWAHVSANYSAHHASAVLSPLALLRHFAGHYAEMPLLLVLGVLGAFFLVRRRRFTLAVGLALLVPGVGLLLLLIAANHTYVSSRYLYVMDIGLVVAAAFGLAVVEVPEVARALRPHRRMATAAALGGAVLVGMAAAPPFAPLDVSTRQDLAEQRTVAQNLVAADAQILAAVGSAATGPSPVMLAPGLWTPRLIVDLRLRIKDVVEPDFNAAGTDYTSRLHVGELVYHDRAGDPVNAVAATLEVGGPAVLGGFRLEPVASDSLAGWWLYRVTGPA